MSDSSFSACAVCQTRTNLLRCSRCKVVKYCSKEHQIQDWPNHKHQCTLLQSTYHNTTNENPTISGYDPPLLEKIELNRNLEMLMTTSPIKGNMILKSQRGECEVKCLRYSNAKQHFLITQDLFFIPLRTDFVMAEDALKQLKNTEKNSVLMKQKNNILENDIVLEIEMQSWKQFRKEVVHCELNIHTMTKKYKYQFISHQLKLLKEGIMLQACIDFVLKNFEKISVLYIWSGDIKLKTETFYKLIFHQILKTYKIDKIEIDEWKKRPDRPKEDVFERYQLLSKIGR